MLFDVYVILHAPPFSQGVNAVECRLALAIRLGTFLSDVGNLDSMREPYTGPKIGISANGLDAMRKVVTRQEVKKT